ncbi:MAG: alkaline phosphatase [Desulfobacterales bacterium]
MIKKLSAIGSLFLSLFLCLGSFGPALSAEGAFGPARNVIVMIVDGCSSEQYTFARWFKGAPLTFDPYRIGAVATYITDSVIADSAPAASAFATGVRTSDKHISVGPHAKTLSVVKPPTEADRYRPFATVLEGAKLLKKSAGIVATSRVSHATPAAYVAHVPSRDMEDDIIEQAVHQGLDVVLGGGKRHLLPPEMKGRRKDGENLKEDLLRWGYRMPETREDLMAIHEGRVFGLFADNHMDTEIDRPRQNPQQPTLAEMTARAIALLSKNPNGFFLMVEGSQVDWACHANDPAYMVHDLLAYDEAVGVALEFARRDGKTLVLALSDHNTGGFSIGNYASSGIYPKMSVEDLVGPVRRMKASASAIWSRLGNDRSPARIKAAVQEGWGIAVTDEEVSEILAVASSLKENAASALGKVLSPRHTYIGWTSFGHCGGDVPLHAFGPGRPEGGLIEAPEIARVCARAMGLDLEALNRRLFVDAIEAFGADKVHLDRSSPQNPVVRIHHGAAPAELPVNKNLLRREGKTLALEGVVVWAPDTGRVYLPLQAVRAIRAEQGPLPEIRDTKSGRKAP